jgi:mono/diheme cytochrome c family protein
VQRPRPRQIAALAIAACASAALAAGCSGGESFDYSNGRELFISNCGTCHALAEAASPEGTGPNLDAAFAESRADGMDSDTIKGVVAGQIANPRPSDPESTNTYMPADLVTGDDAADVAYYVGQVAGVPGIGPPEAPGGPGGQVFANNGCGSCHTLEGFPNASGTLGPNLTETIPGQSPQEVEEDIVDPSAELVQGFPDQMPKNYGDEILGDDLQDLVDFLISWTGDGGGTASGAASGGN